MSSDSRPAPLRLGTVAPNFKAETTNGPIDFHEFIGDNWVVLFSHPEDYVRLGSHAPSLNFKSDSR